MFCSKHACICLSVFRREEIAQSFTDKLYLFLCQYLHRMSHSPGIITSEHLSLSYLVREMKLKCSLFKINHYRSCHDKPSVDNLLLQKSSKFIKINFEHSR